MRLLYRWNTYVLQVEFQVEDEKEMVNDFLYRRGEEKGEEKRAMRL